LRKGELEISYRELEGEASRISRRLQQEGVRRGSVVGVLVEDRVLLAGAVLGILKSGCAFAALDAKLPDEGLRGMGEECEPAVGLGGGGVRGGVLVEAGLKERMRSWCGRMGVVELKWGEGGEREGNGKEGEGGEERGWYGER